MIKKIRKFLSLYLDEKINTIKRKIFAPIISATKIYGKFGKNSLISKPIMIHGKKNIKIGNNVTIRQGARIEVINSWNNQVFVPKLEIGDNVTIEENVHIACAQNIKIENDVTISFDVMIMDNEHRFVENKKIFDNPIETSPIEIGAYSFIGAGVKILKGVKIGRNCIIGAGAVVNDNIPDESIAVGIPAIIKKKRL